LRQAEFDEYKRTSEQIIEEKDAELSKILAAKSALQEQLSALQARLVGHSCFTSLSIPDNKFSLSMANRNHCINN
jgi:hypothetical protein